MAFRRADRRRERKACLESNHAIGSRTKASGTGADGFRSTNHHKFLALLLFANSRKLEAESRLQAPRVRSATCIPERSVNQTRMFRRRELCSARIGTEGGEMARKSPFRICARIH